MGFIYEIEYVIGLVFAVVILLAFIAAGILLFCMYDGNDPINDRIMNDEQGYPEYQHRQSSNFTNHQVTQCGAIGIDPLAAQQTSNAMNPGTSRYPGQSQYVMHTRPRQYTTNVGPSKYTTNAGPHQYATNLGPHQYTTHVGQHQYATNEGSSQYAINERPSQYAINERPSQYAKNEGQDQYARNAGPSQYATNESTSRHITHQQQGNDATCSDLEQHITHQGTIDNPLSPLSTHQVMLHKEDPQE